MEDQDLARRRMRAQRLWGTPFPSVTAAVGALGAVQAQELPFAKWSVGQRTRGATMRTLDEALANGDILRTHVLRPTWHFVLPADIRWMLALTGPRVAARMDPYDRRLELDAKLVARAVKVIARAVAGRHRTRKELGEALARAKIPATGQRLAHIVMRAELDAVVCSGAPRGKQQTYASLDERAPRRARLDQDEMLAELAKRYFTSHGPATVKDFSWWSGLTVATTRQALGLLDDTIAHETVGGRTYWFDPSLPTVRQTEKRFDLVQIYDEIGIAYSESRDVMLGSRTMSFPLGAALVHAVLFDGRYAGQWRASAKTSWDVEVTLRKKPPRAQPTAAVERFRRFMR